MIGRIIFNNKKVEKQQYGPDKSIKYFTGYNGDDVIRPQIW